jgi:secondary thiamine-phosphate synthase enzyme
METLTPATTYRYARLRICTEQATQFFDLTDELVRLAEHAEIDAGVLTVQTLHTTTAIIVNESEPLLLADFEDLLERHAPADGRYRHDDPGARVVNATAGERENGHAHCRALLLPSSATLHVLGGRLLVGRWQRVFFVELDGPREREISALVLGEPR